MTNAPQPRAPTLDAQANACEIAAQYGDDNCMFFPGALWAAAATLRSLICPVCNNSVFESGGACSATHLYQPASTDQSKGGEENAVHLRNDAGTERVSNPRERRDVVTGERASGQHAQDQSDADSRASLRSGPSQEGARPASASDPSTPASDGLVGEIDQHLASTFRAMDDSLFPPDDLLQRARDEIYRLQCHLDTAIFDGKKTIELAHRKIARLETQLSARAADSARGGK